MVVILDKKLRKEIDKEVKKVRNKYECERCKKKFDLKNMSLMRKGWLLCKECEEELKEECRK